MAADDLNLSGRWRGIFNYPRAYPPTQFSAEIREHQGSFDGETAELGSVLRDAGQQLSAFISGVRDGRSVTFVKSYDGVSKARSSVRYDGKLAADGNEITGTWQIPGNWSGTFIMVRYRAGAGQAAVEAQETELLER
ncbi:MAG: hypothetical protein ACKOPG_13905 [Novosphingobium sp.]